MLKDNPQYLPCPVCRTQIPFTVSGLLHGERFVCPNCNAAISLPAESKSQVEAAVEGLERLHSGNPTKQQLL